MNQFMQNLVCKGFHHVLLKYGYESAVMQKQKFDDVTLQYSIGAIYTSLYGTSVLRRNYFLTAAWPNITNRLL